jgi:hypothetical protein
MMAVESGSPIAQALEDSVVYFRQKEKVTTLNVRKAHLEYEQTLVADLVNATSPTYDKTGKVIAATSSTITTKV